MMMNDYSCQQKVLTFLAVIFTLTFNLTIILEQSDYFNVKTGMISVGHMQFCFLFHM